MKKILLSLLIFIILTISSCSPELVPIKLKVVKVLPECSWKDIDNMQLYHIVYLNKPNNTNIYLIRLREGYHIGDTVIYGYKEVY